MRRLAVVLCVLLAACARAGRESRPRDSELNRPKPTVILISFDAMRWDYPDRGLTPNLNALAARGARGDMIPIFPSLTFPNHYSIATGLYADRNGLAGNSFYDPAIHAFYRMSDSLAVRDSRFYGGEPIWVTAERQGMVSSSLFWVGSEAPIGGIRPTFSWNYDKDIADSTRLRALHDWLRLPDDKRPHMNAIYFSVIDDSSHKSGPDSKGTARAIVYADSILGAIMRDVAELPSHEISVVVVSDHGITMAENHVYLSDHMDTTGVRIVGGPVAALWFNGDSVRMRRTYASLESMPHARVLYRSELPAEWHSNTPRAGDIVIVADEHWQVSVRRPTRPPNPATHGYLPTMKDMHGVFIAAGPRIRAGVRVAPFENVHIYPLLAELLGIRPNPDIDGRLEVLRPILRN